MTFQLYVLQEVIVVYVVISFLSLQDKVSLSSSPLCFAINVSISRWDVVYFLPYTYHSSVTFLRNLTSQSKTHSHKTLSHTHTPTLSQAEHWHLNWEIRLMQFFFFWLQLAKVLINRSHLHHLPCKKRHPVHQKAAGSSTDMQKIFLCFSFRP